MTWNEMIQKLFGDKLNETVPQEQVQQQQEQQTQQSANAAAPVVNTNTVNTVNQASANIQQSSVAFSQEQFDALNRRIAELEQANKDLILKGNVNQQPQLTDEQIIYNLCVGGNKHGQSEHTNSNQRGTADG